MTTDQAVRLQCLELAVKAGTPWSRLTEVADRLTIYVKGVSTAPAVEVLNTSTFAAVGAEPIAEDKGVAVEEDQPDWPANLTAEEIAQREALMRNLDYGKSATLANALRATLPADQRGVAVEDPDPVATARAIVAQHDARIADDLARRERGAPTQAELDAAVRRLSRTLPAPPEEPAQTVANDPRLPLVTM